MKGRLRRTKSTARVLGDGIWPSNLLFRQPRGEHGTNLRRPSFCFHTEYAKYSSREELDLHLATERHEP